MGSLESFRSGVPYVSLFFSFLQESKLSQETLADQVVKTNEEKYGLTEKLEAANKVEQLLCIQAIV